jgi:RND family efflux transporter MFP subunit
MRIRISVIITLEKRHRPGGENMSGDISKLKIEKNALPGSPAVRRKRSVLIASAAAALLILGALFFSGALSPSFKAQVVSVSRIYPSQTFTLLNASGYVVAQRKAAVAAKITSQLVALYVEEGSRVKKDSVIARLEGQDAAASRSQAAANLDQARAELADASAGYKRSSLLVKQGYISRSDFDTAEARYKKAAAGVAASRAALKSAEVAVEYTIIRAPFDAVVLTKNADVGDIVTPLGAAANAKASVVTLADMASLQVEVDVSESNIGKIGIGRPCDIQLDALPDMRFRGRAHMIVPTADRSKATVMVKVGFIDKDPRILPEMSAKVAFLSRPVEDREMTSFTAVNKAALVTKDNGSWLFATDGSTARLVQVLTGRRLGDMVEILEGVKAGDRIVANPAEGLRDGSRIDSEEK